MHIKLDDKKKLPICATWKYAKFCEPEQKRQTFLPRTVKPGCMRPFPYPTHITTSSNCQSSNTGWLWFIQTQLNQSHREVKYPISIPEPHLPLPRSRSLLHQAPRAVTLPSGSPDRLVCRRVLQPSDSTVLHVSDSTVSVVVQFFTHAQ